MNGDCGGGSESSYLVVGVNFMNEHPLFANRNPSECSNSAGIEFLGLGAVVLQTATVCLEELRRIMCAQLANLPASFTFITKDGYPIHRRQERLLKASHLLTDKCAVNICKFHDKYRIGIITNNGNCIGFIFTDLNSTLRQVRESIEEQLQHSTGDFRFVQYNGWPITSVQEHTLSVLDVFRNQNVVIQIGSTPLGTHKTPAIKGAPDPTPSPPRPQDLPKVLKPSDDIDGSKPKFNKSLDIQKSKTVVSKEAGLKALQKQYKPILISYVRAEGATHAIKLKQALEEMNVRVFLDIDEIKTGSDWQDALNTAVSGCELFVPLISTMYGKTKWTNREVKLADVLQKKIIPINFMETWPPECLAIQFASTQYISAWKVSESDTDHQYKYVPEPIDNRIWEEANIQRVARELAEHYNQLVKKEKEKTIAMSFIEKTSQRSLKRKSAVRFGVSSKYSFRRKPVETPVADDTDGANVEFMLRSDIHESLDNLLNDKEAKQLVVISAHPRQKTMAHAIRAIIEKTGYDVWTSTDLVESTDIGSDTESAATNPNTPRDLPPIPESGETPLSRVYRDLERMSIQSRRHHSSREADYPERRPVKRLTSQASDISQVSTLGPEKIEKLKQFQEKADQAKVVIVIVSETYTKSRTSQQQIFYCEHRKQIVLIRTEQFTLPGWFTTLMGNDMIKVNNPQFETILTNRVKIASNPDSSKPPKNFIVEGTLQALVQFLRKEVPHLERCVYVAGGSKLQSPRSEEICKEIGKELAKLKSVAVVTGGFYGAPDLVARTFYEARENNKDMQGEKDADVYHVLPTCDEVQDLGEKAHQNADGSFTEVDYGRNIFIGNSVKEREAAVSRIFDVCIVIEGGPGTAHEVEQFLWNDHFVIPIISTGGVAGGQYGIPVKIFEVPPLVNDKDWSVLSEKEATPNEVARAVVKIIVSLKESIFTHNQQRSIKPKKTKKKRSKRLKEQKAPEKNSKVPSESPVVARKSNSLTKSKFPVIAKKSSSRWSRFMLFFTQSRVH